MSIMKTYARIESGRVAEIIAPMIYEIDAPKFEAQPIYQYDSEKEEMVQVGVTEQPADWPAFKAGEEVPISRRFTQDIVAALVDIGAAVVNVGDTYKNAPLSTT